MFAQAAKEQKYNRAYILDRMSDMDIYQKFIGDVRTNTVMRSPIREDKTPSFGLFVASNGNILYKDHATGDSGDVFKLLSTMWNCTLPTVYKRIVDETPNLGVAVKQTYHHHVHNPVNIGIKRRKFSAKDLEYWFDRYRIGTDTLKRFNIFAIDYYVIDNTIRDTYKEGNPIYAYKVHDKFRIYKPLSPTKFAKWRGNLSNTNVFGIEQLPKTGDLLIITKSLKDVAVLFEMGYNAVAPASESSMIPKEIMEELISRFKRVVIFFDNDETGIKFAEEYSELYNIKYIMLDPKTEPKDISDLVDIAGFETAKRRFDKLIE